MADKSTSHQNRTWRALERDLFPYLGHKDIGVIEPFELLQTLRRIEARVHYELANRTKRVASQIFRFAVASGRAVRDPAADLAGTLKTQKSKHMAAITEPKAVGKLLQAIDKYRGSAVVEAALKLSPLLCGRRKIAFGYFGGWAIGWRIEIPWLD